MDELYYVPYEDIVLEPATHSVGQEVDEESCQEDSYEEDRTT